MYPHEYLEFCLLLQCIVVTSRKFPENNKLCVRSLVLIFQLVCDNWVYHVQISGHLQLQLCLEELESPLVKAVVALGSMQADDVRSVALDDALTGVSMELRRHVFNSQLYHHFLECRNEDL